MSRNKFSQSELDRRESELSYGPRDQWKEEVFNNFRNRRYTRRMANQETLRDFWQDDEMMKKMVGTTVWNGRRINTLRLKRR